jgi:D-arabinose 1-dehydrogenase-like Zn-dependent alcohol dehydrogenase
MATMRAVQVAKKGGPLELVEKPLPEPGPTQVRIKVQACGICHSDSIVVQGLFGVEFPRVPGHEVIGVIDAVGHAVPPRWKAGMRVGVGWHAWHCLS